ncbi:MAG: hypothetical protein J5780_02775, partial [Treponema sp.]|nr:hypothetical protein [Treponema sp.]
YYSAFFPGKYGNLSAGALRHLGKLLRHSQFLFLGVSIVTLKNLTTTLYPDCTVVRRNEEKKREGTILIRKTLI